MSVKPNILKYFKANHFFLIKAVLLEWSKFLEKINIGLPMLISKVEDYERQRHSLERAKNILSKYFDKCFYCKNTLASERQMVHVDHFVPWSYIFEDELWNLVLSCRKCNLKKHSSLPPYQYIELLAKRNTEYCNVIGSLKKSLLKLEPESNYENAIRKHFYNCADYGFTIINSL